MERTKLNMLSWLFIFLFYTQIPSRLARDNERIQCSKSLPLLQESRGLETVTLSDNEESTKHDPVSLAKGKSGGRGSGGGTINHTPCKNMTSTEAPHRILKFVMVLSSSELIFAMDQEIEDTIKAFTEGEYGVAIRKDDEAKVRPSARECKKNPSVKLSPETAKTFDFGPFSPCSEDQTDKIVVQVHDSIPTREETMVQAAEKDRKRKLAIANWDWENVVDLTNCEDGPDADEKVDAFYATDNDDLYDFDLDDLSDSVLCFKPSSNQSRLARRARRRVILD
ncbi:hypothetical protein L1987_45072 [Smallanthus sonchifolius]|uniref:Uncharacterized protein n=1 Tax=Smallanthus sonchifolius TaxID=185202 RepID=A0ACB9GRW0_9ASTR|nr:hypothetical protein L1987_45072 [Smallanthus sonchifolius]